MSQETLLRENVILNIVNIEFPAKPAVSAECRDFIVCCLQKDVQKRWGVAELCEHPFITQTKQRFLVCVKKFFCSFLIRKNVSYRLIFCCLSVFLMVF